MAQAQDPAEVDYAKIIEEIKDRRQGTINYRAGEDMIDRVRAYEKAELALPPPSARGDGMDKLSLLDPLTELYNFRTFLKELKAELTRAKRYKQPCSIVLLTVDNFDEVVHQHGYVTGDAVLKVIANVMRTALREVDIPAKYGTQEFAVILPQTGPAGAALVAERLRQRIGNQAISLNWQSFSVTASAGVAAYPAHAGGYDELIARAMEALQWALERGGDRVLAP
jgi:diguanylate cyclase (GGDEF)-like protein